MIGCSLFTDILKRILSMLKGERLGAANAYPMRLLAEVLAMYAPSQEAASPTELVDVLKTGVWIRLQEAGDQSASHVCR